MFMMEDDMHPMDPTIAVRPDQWMKPQNLANPMNPMSPLNPMNQHKATTETTEPAKAEPIVYTDQSGDMTVGVIVITTIALVAIATIIFRNS